MGKRKSAARVAFHAILEPTRGWWVRPEPHQTGAPFALQVCRSRVEECALTFALAPIHVGGEVRERLSGICWARDALGVRILL